MKRDSMTVQQLITKLQSLDGSREVMFAYGSGDHWKTTVCSSVSVVEESNVKWSDYHNKFSLPKEEIEDEVENKDVVIIG